MSHSKCTKRGFSLYIERWNPNAKKYINICAICGRTGYSPVIGQEEFREKNRVIFNELSRTLGELELDELGRCAVCARIQDKDRPR